MTNKERIIKLINKDEKLMTKVIDFCKLSSIETMPSIKERVKEGVDILIKAEAMLTIALKEANEINTTYLEMIRAYLDVSKMNDQRLFMLNRQLDEEIQKEKEKIEASKKEKATTK